MEAEDGFSASSGPALGKVGPGSHRRSELFGGSMRRGRLDSQVTMAALPGPIYADAVAVDINLEADDVYDWERLLLSTIDEGEHVYRVYQQGGGGQFGHFVQFDYGQ
ncbi:hypothetical protein AK812_SmicGene5725 [Symbiodinium microadriaticum]|uniref:Uncharacterized protein n=1 Tax=Symbiodinium microadriaticum TaxID=2951 RepID=A0A1Q9ESX8_SYMMI|nr:hypothetical protein AK812_SmicGene5725 [Symbiodinium microadriaticum]